jgi:hypothetical protein
MKNKIILLFLIGQLFYNCAVSKGNKCEENLKFKEVFMLNISKVENYVNGKGHKEEFKEGLAFISKYSEVSYLDMLNYSGSYSSYKSFENDKNNWLKWYEENKCTGIKFKQ